MSANLDALTAQVAASTAVEASAVVLIEGLAKQLADAIAAAGSGDTSALPALQASLEASAKTLGDAITANTPAAPTA